MLALLIGLLFLVVLQEVGGLVAIAGDCPLDFSWANFTLATSACSDPNARGQCCRYINAFVTISIAHYANETGKLGVPSVFSEICLTFISETFGLHGIPHTATVFCGLGPKIQVSYQCSGRGTVLEMMQSPDFGDVIVNCEMPLTLENNCRRCLNSGILYLHRLIGPDNNVALSMCRDAVFVVLATQGGMVSVFDMASCFFGLQRLRILPGLSSQVPQPNSPPSPPSFQSTVQNLTNVTDTPLKKHQHSYLLTLIPAVGVMIITVAVLLLLILLILIHKKSKELKCTDDHLEKSRSSSPIPTVHKCQDGPSLMFQRFSYKETMKATDNFSTIIGKGGFGTVYKAQFSDGTIGAVKRMNKISKQGEVEFCREMELLARLHHRHLVALIGFCIDRNERFLVYEYMENGCLKDHLHAPGKASLSWPARLQIAVDVANALEYLHFYCNPPLCHRDIKSSNILLDGNFVAKIADFGLAHASRSGTISFEPVNTDIRGTPVSGEEPNRGLIKIFFNRHNKKVTSGPSRFVHTQGTSSTLPATHTQPVTHTQQTAHSQPTTSLPTTPGVSSLQLYSADPRFPSLEPRFPSPDLRFLSPDATQSTPFYPYYPPPPYGDPPAYPYPPYVPPYYPPPPPQPATSGPSTAAAAEQTTDGRMLIAPDGDTFYPSKQPTHKIRDIILSMYDAPYVSWKKVLKEVRDMWFREFELTNIYIIFNMQRDFCWLPQHNDKIRKNF
ncbi:hypothetical protein M5K25_006858 [Dendrobium thyrsiflorum]|uniref:Protein kinase domain-containing protein n=1 Tax=Dendrobium thyrsiflorum TaxID=117978 RepID=A0ABD0VCR9_DENTH